MYNSSADDNRIVLYNNNGDGTFTDETEAAGIQDLLGVTYGGGFADYDNDGDLDLYITLVDLISLLVTTTTMVIWTSTWQMA